MYQPNDDEATRVFQNVLWPRDPKREIIQKKRLRKKEGKGKGDKSSIS
jgi:hypothetical protein